MKNFEVTYTKGHLVDLKTGKRIFLKRGGKFNILGDDDQFEEKDELEINQRPLLPPEKLLSLKNQHKNFHLEKIGCDGQVLKYKVGLSKTISEDKNNSQFYFDAVLLEDLYLRSKDKINWSLCDCQCKTTKCLSGNLQMIESVQGLSLSNLFSNVVAFYFPHQRSGACNAFTTFYKFFDKDEGLKNNRNKLYIDSMREAIVLKYKLKDMRVEDLKVD